MSEQVLDFNWTLERERGITIKATKVGHLKLSCKKMGNLSIELYRSLPACLNFTYELSRSLAAFVSALLVVDAGQGVGKLRLG